MYVNEYSLQTAFKPSKHNKDELKKHFTFTNNKLKRLLLHKQIAKKKRLKLRERFVNGTN